MDSVDGQLEFDFSVASGSSADGARAHDRWRTEMREQDEAESHRLGLPLRRRVEVKLENGALLSGRLLLAHPELLRLERRPAKLALMIGDSLFDHTQIARCLVLDDEEPDERRHSGSDRPA